MLLHKCKGYTLVEIMIAIVIGLILIASVTATYVVQTRSYVSQKGVAEVTDQSKVAHDIIANSIKMAGFGAPDKMTRDSINNVKTVIEPFDNTTAPDAITIVGGLRWIGSIWPVGVAPGITCPGYINIESTSVDIRLSGALYPNDTDMSYLSFDGIQYVQATIVSTTFKNKIPQVSTIDFIPKLPMPFRLIDTTGNGKCDTGRPVYLVEAVTFCVNGSTLQRIWRNANAANCSALKGSSVEVIANNIEDLQFAYAVDSNGDGQLDTDSSGIAFFDGSSVANYSTIKAVRINILAKGNRPDPNFLSLGKPPARIENRNHSTNSTEPDDFRRRWWQTTVKIRN